MDLVILGSALLGLLILAVVVLLLRGGHDRFRSASDLRRAGGDSETSRTDAANRATGSTAWMRPGGGGV